MAVAGSFYPQQKVTLHNMIQKYLADNPIQGKNIVYPKALIVPHAGYIYSGKIAAKAYHYLYPLKDKIKRVILIGPAHRVPVPGLAISQHDAFATPLGNILVDQKAIAKIKHLPQVLLWDDPHKQEHSLEVHLPLLIEILEDFTIVPILAGDVDPIIIAQVLEILWGEEETLIVISSDLSHFHSYAKAQALDLMTANSIEAFDYQAIHWEQACGRIPISGLLIMAKKLNLTIKRLSLCNSGDTAGNKDRVVGYGTWLFSKK